MSTPFYLGDVDFDGTDPGEPQPWVPPGKFYLGRPDQQMVQLPKLNSYTPNLSQGEVENGLAGGLSSVQRLSDSTLRRYTLGWNLLAGRDQAIVDGFYRRRIFGTRENSKGPWAFVPPEDVNRLTAAQSMCGADTGVVEGWASANVPVFQPTIAPAIMPGGTMLWQPPAVGAVLRAAPDPANPTIPDPLRAPPYLPGESCGFLFWAWSFDPIGTSSASVAARVTGRLADGTQVGTATGASVTVSQTVPQPVYVLLDPGDLVGAQYALVSVVSNDEHAMYVSNPVFWYGEDIRDWGIGCGVPRVTCPVALGDSAPIPAGPRPMQLVLSESVSGAA